MKATYGEVLPECKCDANNIAILDRSCNPLSDFGACQIPEAREIYKDPITDSGEKKSARGLLRVDYNEQGEITLYQQQTKEQEEQGLLKTIFLDGRLTEMHTLNEIRERLQKTL